MNIEELDRTCSSPPSKEGVPIYDSGRKWERSESFGWVKCLISILVLLLPQLSNAQCAMCRAVLESEENVAMAEGVNNGIVYLMAVPYVLVAVLFYFVYRKMRS